MERECGLIQDLLPLYAEGMASDASARAVETHLKDCPSCAAALHKFREEAKVLPDEALPLRRVRRGLARRRLRAVAVAVLAVLALCASVLSFLTTPLYLADAEGQLDVSLRGDGMLLISARNEGYYLEAEPLSDPDGSAGRYVAVSVFHYPRGVMKGQSQLVLELKPGEPAGVYFTAPGQRLKWVWGRDFIGEDGMMLLPRLALAYYLYLAMLLLAVLLLLWLLLRRRRTTRRVTEALLGLPLCYLAGHFLIKRFSTFSYHLLTDLGFILLCAALLYAAWLLLAWGRWQRADAAAESP